MELYREAVPAFKFCAQSEYLKLCNPRYSKPASIQRANGDVLVRTSTSQPSLKAFRAQFSRLTKAHEHDTRMRLSYYRIWLSGKFYRIYMEEQAGTPADFRAMAREHMETCDCTDKSDKALRTKLAKTERGYRIDYQRWKKAFRV